MKVTQPTKTQESLRANNIRPPVELPQRAGRRPSHHPFSLSSLIERERPLFPPSGVGIRLGDVLMRIAGIPPERPFILRYCAHGPVEFTGHIEAIVGVGPFVIRHPLGDPLPKSDGGGSIERPRVVKVPKETLGVAEREIEPDENSHPQTSLVPEKVGDVPEGVPASLLIEDSRLETTLDRETRHLRFSVSSPLPRLPEGGALNGPPDCGRPRSIAGRFVAGGPVDHDIGVEDRKHETKLYGIEVVSEARGHSEYCPKRSHVVGISDSVPHLSMTCDTECRR